MLILAFAAVADVTKLAFIIGAFMAGLALGRVEGHERIVTDLGAVGKILIPVFFVSIGIAADLEAMIEPAVLGLAGGAVRRRRASASSSAAYGVGRIPVDKLTIGIGMVPRGEVGLIFASIGLANGVLDAEALRGAAARPAADDHRHPAAAPLPGHEAGGRLAECARERRPAIARSYS